MLSGYRVRLTAVCAAALLLAGCQSASPRAGQTSGRPEGSPPAGSAKTLRAGETDNGHVLNLGKGDVVVVTLHSTYWQLAPLTSGAALRASGPAAVVPSRVKACMPGQGCGTVTQAFRATAPGRVVITASRTTCGEALHCTGSQGSYRLAVVVG